MDPKIANYIRIAQIVIGAVVGGLVTAGVIPEPYGILAAALGFHALPAVGTETKK